MVLQATKKFRGRYLSVVRCYIVSVRVWWCISTLGVVLSLCCCTRPPMPSGTSWDQRSGLFRWWGGEVTLPVGFTYQQDVSDTFEGHFTSSLGKLIIHHDIGGYAGAWARSKGSDAFEERIVEGARVWTGQRRSRAAGDNTVRFAVTFPDNGCANFYLTSNNINDAAIIGATARSFRPKATSVARRSCGSER